MESEWNLNFIWLFIENFLTHPDIHENRGVKMKMSNKWPKQCVKPFLTFLSKKIFFWKKVDFCKIFKFFFRTQNKSLINFRFFLVLFFMTDLFTGSEFKKSNVFTLKSDLLILRGSIWDIDLAWQFQHLSWYGLWGYLMVVKIPLKYVLRHLEGLKVYI